MSLRLRIHSKQFFIWFLFLSKLLMIVKFCCWCFISGCESHYFRPKAIYWQTDDNIYLLCLNSVLSISLFNLSVKLAAEWNLLFRIIAHVLHRKSRENRTVLFYGRNDHKLLSALIFIEMLKLQYNLTKIEDPQNFHKERKKVISAFEKENYSRNWSIPGRLILSGDLKIGK